MHESPESDVLSRAQRCAHAWATLSRALATYPATNIRVECQLDIFLRTLDALLDETGFDDVSITLQRGHLFIDGDETPTGPEGPLQWLELRLETGALAGARFARGVERDTLVAFTMHLLELFVDRRDHAPFPELWPTEFPGIAPIPRRFEGTFRTEIQVDAPDEPDEPAPAPATHTETRERVVLPPSKETTVERLVRAADVQTALAGVRNSLTGIEGERETVQVGELLRRIVAFLPNEVVDDEAALQDVTVAILHGLAHRFERSGMEAGLDELRDDARLRRMMFVTSRALFGRDSEQGDVHLDAERARMRAEYAAAESDQQRSLDDRIADDTAALLREYAQMPTLDEDPLPLLESRAEQLGIYLHFLVREEPGPLLERVEQRIARLLRDPAPDFPAVLRPYVTAARFGDDAHRWDRVETLLRRTRRYDLLRQVGAFSADDIANAFPAEFGTYLGTLDHAVEEDRQELIDVCASVGLDGFRRHLPELLSDARVDRPTVWTGMLSEPGAARALAAGTLLLALDELRYKPRIVDLLRRTRGEEREAILLRVAERPQDVPSAYLRLFMDHETGTVPSAALVEAIASRLVAEYRERVEAQAPEDERVAVLQAFAAFDCEASRRFLNEVASARRFGFIPVGGRVERAARAVLVGYESTED